VAVLAGYVLIGLKIIQYVDFKLCGTVPGGLRRELFCDSVISDKPLPGDGMRLGGRIWDFFIIWL
jgi:hypothetical protein